MPLFPTRHTRPVALQAQADLRPLSLVHVHPPAGTTDYVPRAGILLDARLRESGLLTLLPAEDLRSLLLLLTFVTSGGEVWATPGQLTAALGLPATVVRARLRALARHTWNGRPLLHELRTESGMVTLHASPRLFEREHVHTRPPAAPGSRIVAASREAVIAHSRATYGRPRAEVEAQIAKLNCWDLPPEQLSEEEQVRVRLRQRLRLTGLSVEQADTLLSRFSAARIERQIDALPYRNAKRPAHYLIAAIEHDYELPGALRRGRLPDKHQSQRL